MSLVSGVRSGIQSGLRSGLNPSYGGISVGTDGPDSVYLPRSAADWVELGLPAPTYQWNCQESSGNLTTGIGTPPTLTANATPLYQQTVTDWTTKFVGTTNATSNQRFGTSDAALDFSSSTSYAWLFYASAAATSSTRTVFCANGTANRIDIQTSGIPRVLHGPTGAGVTATLTQDHSSGVHAWIWYRNATASGCGLITDLETKTNTYFSDAVTAQIKCVGATGATAPTARYTLCAFWSGADAETIAQASTLTTLGW